MNATEREDPGLAVPLVVGVTGHRDLHPDDLPAIRQRVQEFFDRLLEDYPHTPIMVLSALVAGADRLVAEEALKRKERISLTALLPWAPGLNDYAMVRGGEVEEFNRLVDAAHRVICLPLDGEAGVGDLSSDKVRARQFDQMGHYLAAQSQVLLALWDGQGRAESATWKVIRWQQDGAPAVFDSGRELLDEPETGPVYQVRIRCLGEELSTDGITLRKLPATAYAEVFPKMVKHLDAFNRDVAELDPSDESGMGRSKGYVIPKSKLPELSSEATFLLDRYAAADVLAQRQQNITRKSIITFFVLVFAMVAAFEFHAHLLPSHLWLLAAYLGILVVGFAGAWFVGKREVHRRYLDYRALAEAMRVQLFWDLAGIRNAVSDHYLRSFRSELDWIRVAGRSWVLQSGAHDCSACDPSPGEANYSLIQTHWVEDQLKFFRKSSKRHEDKLKRLHWITRILLGCSVVVIIVQICRLASDQHHYVGHNDDHLTHYLLIAAALCLVAAGLLHEFGEKMALRKQARSYEQMSSLFGTASAKMERLIEVKDWPAAHILLTELGREALAENADWVLYHRERPPEMKAH